MPDGHIHIKGRLELRDGFVLKVAALSKGN